MSQDEIISMAREAGFRAALDGEHDMVADFDHLHRFAALVAAHERELCAKVCEERGFDQYIEQQCAVAIRTRGEK